MKIAVITGASSGLGRVFARLLVRKDPPEELWLIARRRERLEELAAELPVPCRVLPLDLTDGADLEAYRALLETEAPEVTVLICNAGMARMGRIDELSPADTAAMIDLNCRAAALVTALTLPYIHRGGRILEVASTAAFQPLPRLGVYAASKAFLYRYSRTLSWELHRRGIHVTAVCPYWVKDTEFIPTAQAGGHRDVRHFLLAGRSESVVKAAWLASRSGMWLSTPGIICFLHWIVAKFVPSVVMMALWEGIRRL